jgi:hypothetical protein
LSGGGVSGTITINTGTVTLAGSGLFQNDVVTLEDTKTHPAPATLAIAANNTLAALDVTGKKGS